jgi:FkbM family methyltransferase
MAHLAALCPEARIVGVELDEENAAFARANTKQWGERCRVLVAAAWSEDRPLRYEIEQGGESGAAVTTSGGRVVSGRSLTSLLADLRWSHVDFVKIDVEGAERAILGHNTGWAGRVRAIKVEAHPPYGRDECERDLRRLGFVTTVDPRHFSAVGGVRDA